MLDGRQFGEEVLGIVKGFLDKALARVDARIEALEKREPPVVPDHSAAIDRLDARIEELSKGVSERIAAAVGEKGPELIAPLIARVEELEKREPPVVPDHSAAIDRLDARIEELSKGVEERVAAVVGEKGTELLAPLIARVEEVEKREPVPGPKGDRGASIRICAGMPTEDGQAGDVCIDPSTGDIYEFIS